MTETSRKSRDRTKRSRSRQATPAPVSRSHNVITVGEMRSPSLITPVDNVDFRCQSKMQLCLGNKCEKLLVFKVKTTRNSHVHIRPVRGFLLPFANTSIKLSRYPYAGTYPGSGHLVVISAVETDSADNARQAWLAAGSDSKTVSATYVIKLPVLHKQDDYSYQPV